MTAAPPTIPLPRTASEFTGSAAPPAGAPTGSTGTGDPPVGFQK